MFVNVTYNFQILYPYCIMRTHQQQVATYIPYYRSSREYGIKICFLQKSYQVTLTSVSFDNSDSDDISRIL